MCIRDSSSQAVDEQREDQQEYTGSQVYDCFRKQHGTSFVARADIAGKGPVSYTHLDVYKRQLLQVLHLSPMAQDWLASYGTAMGSVILIEGWMWSGFNMFIFISGLQAIPRDYYEAAETEGISRFNQFRHITLPLLVPSFTVIITLNVTGSLKVFDLIYVLTNGGPGFDTQVLSTFTYRAFGLGLLGESSASAVVLMVVVTVISFILNKILRRREVEL